MLIDQREDSVEGQPSNSNTLLSQAHHEQNVQKANNGDEHLIEYCLENRAKVVLNDVNNVQMNESNLNNQLEDNTVPIPNNIQMADIDEPNEAIIDTSTMAIKTEPNNNNPIPNVSILFNQSKRIKTIGNVSMFHKTKATQDNNSSLKVLCDGSYVEIDESKCLEWIQNNIRDMVEFCAIPNDIAKPSRCRRSGRLARMENVDYSERSMLKKRKKRI